MTKKNEKIISTNIKDCFQEWLKRKWFFFYEASWLDGRKA